MSTTKRFRFSHVALAKQVMDEKDPQGAADHIMSIAGKEHPDKIIGAFKNVRVRIMNQPKYTNADGEQEAISLLSFPGLEEADKRKLEQLLLMPVSKRHWAQNFKVLFQNKELDTKYKAIKFFKDPFYDFKMQESVVKDCGWMQDERVVQNHSHTRKDQSNYHFSQEEIDQMINDAIIYCESDQDWSKRCCSLRLLEAVGLLTGRRKWELSSTLKIRSVPESDYQAEVRGMAKTLFAEEDWRRIPLLAPISVIVSAISKIRRYHHVSGDYSATKRLFPKLTHTKYRDIYASKAYEQRDINKFHPESCSLLWFRSQALLINFQTCAAHYSTMVIDRDESRNEEPEFKKPRVEEEVANSTGGSSDLQFQDSL